MVAVHDGLTHEISTPEITPRHTPLMSPQRGCPNSAVLSALHKDKGAQEDELGGFMLSMPTDISKEQLAGGDLESSASEGYLITLPGKQFGPTHMFAVPELTPEPEEHQSLLQRAASFKLPTDVVDVTIEHEQSIVQLSVDKTVPVVGWVILAVALLCGSSMGPLIDKQDGGTVVAKILWRSTIAAVGMSVIALVAEGGFGRYKEVLTDQHMLKMLLLSWGGWVLYMGAFQVSCSITSVMHAYLFGQSVSVFVVLHKLVSGQSVSRLELGGVLLAMTGAGLCLLDKGSGDHKPDIKGDMIAMSSALGGAVFLTAAKSVRSKVNTYMFYSFMHMWSAVALLIAAAFTLRSEGFDGVNGAFGWTHAERFDRLPLQLIIFAVCDVAGLCGYVLAMKYFDPLLISLVMLTEPLVSTAEGILLGVADFPGPFSIGGAVVMFIGIGFVSNGAKNSSTTVDASSALAKQEPEEEECEDLQEILYPVEESPKREHK
eukprot:TRINITY_DN5524_c0_g1_i6.p1 TRINITY_DN5524_c0_g1~~TRINITY_DN5524_c0_g1_i6.p1  ORF type:complete len:488 (-),score=146.55 TRINITY_DN5524_c0_g1_i6:227-1690(-)